MGIYFLIVFFTINLSMLNLILSVIMEAAVATREAEKDAREEDRIRSLQQEKDRLVKLCAEIDSDESGTIDLDELTEAFDNKSGFSRTIKSLGAERKDMAMIFQLLDPDSSNSVDYEEFADQMYKLTTEPSQ